jgi:hypothetical protein
MTAVLLIAGIETEAVRRDYLLVKAIIENVGSEPVGPGTVVARQISHDGSLRSVEFFNSVTLSPGDKTKVTQLLRGHIKEVEFRAYRQTDGESIPLCGLIKRSLLPRSITDPAESFVTDVLTPIYKGLTERIPGDRIRKKWQAFTRTEKVKKTAKALDVAANED